MDINISHHSRKTVTFQQEPKCRTTKADEKSSRQEKQAREALGNKGQKASHISLLFELNH
jgi:hypothetical protein